MAHGVARPSERTIISRFQRDQTKITTRSSRGTENNLLVTLVHADMST